MTELTHQKCPFCDGEEFAYSTETGKFNCFSGSCGAKPSTKRGLCFDGVTIEPFTFNNTQREEGISLEPYYKEHRGIQKTIMEKYGAYFTDNNGAETVHFTYPEATKHKNQSIPKKDKGHILTSGSMDKFYGQDDYAGGLILTITEGEEDRLSVIQMMGDYPTVSVPSASPSKDFWENARTYLAKFDKVHLSVDNDPAGDKLAEQFFRIFAGKVYRVDHGKYKDANDFLVADDYAGYKKAYWAAQKIKPETINTTAEDFLKVYDETPDYEYFKTGIDGLDHKMLGIHKSAMTMILAPTGIGKSLAPDTPVLRANGKVVRADEVNVGDQLMGPDSKPRNVTNVNLQTGPMYRITPTKGEPFECNADHILSLKHTTTDEVKNVVLTEYLNWSKAQKHLWKLWRTGVTRFSPLGPNQPSLAYAVGAYLGDGRVQGPELCMGKAKQPVIDYMMDSGWLNPTRMKFDRGAYYIGFSKKDMLWDYVSNHTGQSEDCLTVRKMPDVMKRGYIDTRKAILAGLLDTDGSVSGGGAEITQKSEVLSDDICFVARSLGLAAYKKSKWVNGTEYFRVGISGDMTVLPCKRLKFKPRKQVKSVLKTGFTVQPIGEGVFRGIALDGDHLFLLGDFTVTHNTEFVRYLEKKCYDAGHTFGACHGEETELRSLLGLVSYELNDNLTRKDLIESKGREQEVRDELSKLGKSEQINQFVIRVDQGPEDIIEQIRFLVSAMGCDYIFLEPIQDFVTGTTSEKENKLTDLANTMKRLCAEINVGIVIIAHANEDGDAKYCKSLTQSAAYEIVLERDPNSEDQDEANTTKVFVGRKNRTGGGSGFAGELTFGFDTYTLTPTQDLSPVIDRSKKVTVKSPKLVNDGINF